MQVITVINAKGGCGKSTIAMNLASALSLDGFHTLLIDLDPQAQLTDWLHAGDGLNWRGTIVESFMGDRELSQLIQPTLHERLSFIPSAEGLEELGRMMAREEDYEENLARLLHQADIRFDFLVVDSPNQISPVMRNAIFPADLFVIPFESTKAVKSYGNIFKLIHEIRPHGDYRLVHVLNNLKLQGLRKRVIQAMEADDIPIARTEIRNCGWLARVDDHGGSIFDFRPRSKSANDLNALKDEILFILEQT